MVDKQTQLDQIKAEIIKANVCPNLAKTAKHLVFGEGSPNARVMFIGEAPGRQEDETGRPFIGAAGKFLDELLESVKIKRDDVYITSILKYRPPNNRDPKPAEKAEFWPYLLRQIEVIRPEVIVTLGKHSTNCFLPEVQISKVHGRPQQWQGWTILPLYHPAVVLYGGKRQPLFDDIAVIAKLIRNK